MEDAFTGNADPLSGESATEPQAETQAPETQTGEGEQPAPPEPGAEPQAAGADPLKGTPFRDVGGLVKSYKEIQRLVSSKDNQIQQLTEYLRRAVGYIQNQGQAGPQGNQPQSGIPQGEDFWKAFAENPQAVLSQLVELGKQRGFGTRDDRLDAQRFGKLEQLAAVGGVRADCVNLVNGHLQVEFAKAVSYCGDFIGCEVVVQILWDLRAHLLGAETYDIRQAQSINPFRRVRERQFAEVTGVNAQPPAE